MHKRKIIAASALLAPFALAAIFLSHRPQSPAIKPSQVHPWDCAYVDINPETSMVKCGDRGMYVNKIEWSRCDAKDAHRIGFHIVYDCDQDCVDGTIHAKKGKNTAI